MIKKCPSKEKKLVLNYLDERFGISKENFKGFTFYINQNQRVFLGPMDMIRHPEPVATGLLIARIENAIKPSTNFFHMFGHLVKENIIELDKDQAKEYIEGNDLESESDLASGYVLVKYKEYPLGCAHFKNNLLKNHLPKSKWTKLEF